jgi:hypothetical protein
LAAPHCASFDACIVCADADRPASDKRRASHPLSLLRANPKVRAGCADHMIEPEASERTPSTGADSAPLMAAYRSTITLSDLTGVVAAAQEIQRLFNNETPWWRGHANVGWRLEAQVHRQNLEHPEPRPYDEPSLIGHFVSRAPSRSHRPCPDADDYFGWLFLAQHYGLPTRLLDWSENPLVAAYFAVQDLDDDGCVWALSPTGLNRGATYGLIKITDPKAIEFAKSAFTGQNCRT